jgi:hypothetical protein
VPAPVTPAPSPGKPARRRPPLLRLLSPKRAVACTKPKAPCRAVIPLRLRLSAAARLQVDVERRRGHAWRPEGSSVQLGRRGANVLKLSARGARPGRYRVTVRAMGAGGRSPHPVRLALVVARAHRHR